jgi:frataxin-like iron-binding protein CyaY
LKYQNNIGIKGGRKMKGKKKEKLLIGAIGLFLILTVMPGTAYAEVPLKINYQGFLTDSGGEPVNGYRNFKFHIYNQLEGGASQWGAETHNNVLVSNGIFNVILRETTSLTPTHLYSDDTLYLGIEVGSGGSWDGQMSPRQQLTSVAYSIWAKSVENVTASTADPDNTFVGVDAGLVTTGGWNTFLGYTTGEVNTSGSQNTFIGSEAGAFNTTGFSNTFIGRRAGENNTSGNANTFIGKDAGRANISGGWNTFLGYLSGVSNTTGKWNTFIGTSAGEQNTIGDGNTFIGHHAGRQNEGDKNIFIGFEASYHEPAASSNKLIIESLQSSTPLIYGDFYSDLLTVNGRLLISQTSVSATIPSVHIRSSGAIFEGMTDSILVLEPDNPSRDAGLTLKTTRGTDHTYQIRAGDGHIAVDNKNFAIYDVTNNILRVTLDTNGNLGINTPTPTRKLFVNGDAGGTTHWYEASDRNLKKNIRTIEGALEKVENLRGVYYEWKDIDTRSEGQQLGMIAQEVMGVVPEVVQRKGEYYSMATAGLVPLLIEAVKDQQEIIDELIAKLDELENGKRAEIDSLRDQLTHLRALVETVMVQQTESKDNKDLLSMNK